MVPWYIPLQLTCRLGTAAMPCARSSRCACRAERIAASEESEDGAVVLLAEGCWARVAATCALQGRGM